ncbi:MAG: hypothetical protein PHU53_05020 [Thermoplasmata archaeon]|nr:hypothetical protein [Thermoplasmata archaeon]
MKGNFRFNLRKITGMTSLAFGIYSIIVAALIILYESVEFFIIFAIIFAAFGVLYTVAGISLLKNGRFGFFVFMGVFSTPYFWGPDTPLYIWPMVIMPIVILLLFLTVFLKETFN